MNVYLAGLLKVFNFRKFIGAMKYDIKNRLFARAWLKESLLMSLELILQKSQKNIKQKKKIILVINTKLNFNLYAVIQ